jgi:fumarate hydratase subunit alpha
VRDALTDRSNPGTNLPAFIDCVYLPVTESGNGDDSTASDSSADYSVRVSTMLKGGGSDNSSIVTMLPPAADLQQAGGQTEAAITQLLLNLVAEKGSNACPPLIVGIGVGATFDKVASLSKRALLRPLDQSSANPLSADLERRVLGKLNASNIGPAGLGGDTTALAVHIETAASHIASLPVAINLGCHSLRRKTTAITSAFPTDF